MKLCPDKAVPNAVPEAIPEAIPEYGTLGCALRGVCQTWCETHGYCDPFLQDGEWWAFPPSSVMPVQVKHVMGQSSQRSVKIESVTLTLFPDGSLAREINGMK
ncbi:MAG: hypothetical protein AAFN12_18635 [Cyanobacteria bacterium J06560_2]